MEKELIAIFEKYGCKAFFFISLKDETLKMRIRNMESLQEKTDEFDTQKKFNSKVKKV